jgi:predicted negative regulator of RcsB-dependent stress response
MTNTEQFKETWLEKVNNLRMAVVQVEQGETDKEAWLRHLEANPQDRYANVWVFNRPWAP